MYTLHLASSSLRMGSELETAVAIYCKKCFHVDELLDSNDDNFLSYFAFTTVVELRRKRK